MVCGPQLIAQLFKPFRDRVQALEQQLEELGDELRATEARLADADVYHSLAPAELDTLLANAGATRKRLEATEQEWLEASEALELFNFGWESG